jgi:hypothetical protein
MNLLTGSELSITPTDPLWVKMTAELVLASKPSQPGLIIAPMRLEGDLAIFPDSQLMLGKELRAAGIGAQYLSGPKGRTFQSHYSAVSDSVVDFIGSFLFNFAVEAAYDTCKGTFEFLRERYPPRRTEEQASIRLGMRVSPDGTSDVWYDATAPASQLLPMTERLVLEHLALVGTQSKPLRPQGEGHDHTPRIGKPDQS